MSTIHNFTCDSLPNVHLELTALGVNVCVSLNIEPKLRKYLSPNNVHKANKFYIYMLKCPITIVNSESVNIVQRELLNKAMINVREAKKKILEDEIVVLKRF